MCSESNSIWGETSAAGAGLSSSQGDPPANSSIYKSWSAKSAHVTHSTPLKYRLHFGKSFCKVIEKLSTIRARMANTISLTEVVQLISKPVNLESKMCSGKEQHPPKSFQQLCLDCKVQHDLTCLNYKKLFSNSSSLLITISFLARFLILEVEIGSSESRQPPSIIFAVTFSSEATLTL